MVQQPNFDRDLAIGEEFEDLIRGWFRGTKIPDHHRDRGDMILDNGLYIECKRDIAAGETGNLLLELADVTPDEDARLTGVFKHSHYGFPVVVVHAIGNPIQHYLVYSPYEVVTYLERHSANLKNVLSPVRRSTWFNIDKRRQHNRTTGLIIRLTSLTKKHTDPLLNFPAIKVVSEFDLPETVLEVANDSPPVSGGVPAADLEAIYRTLLRTFPSKRADLQGRHRRVAVEVKGTNHDPVHAVLRGQQKAVG